MWPYAISHLCIWLLFVSRQTNHQADEMTVRYLNYMNFSLDRLVNIVLREQKHCIQYYIYIISPRYHVQWNTTDRHINCYCYNYVSNYDYIQERKGELFTFRKNKQKSAFLPLLLIALTSIFCDSFPYSYIVVRYFYMQVIRKFDKSREIGDYIEKSTFCTLSTPLWKTVIRQLIFSLRKP